MLIIFIPIALWFVFSLIDWKYDSDIERIEEHYELMDELEQQALDAEERHIEMMHEYKKNSYRTSDDSKRRPIRTERRIIRKPDGSYVAQEITEYEVD